MIVVFVHAMRHSDRIVNFLYFTAVEYGNTKQIVISYKSSEKLEKYGQI